MRVHFEDRESWRGWLDENLRETREVWLVFDKTHTGRRCITYDAAVEEALCVGWIDSIIKRLDGERYMRKFTPRTNTGNWSKSNLRRVEKLVAAGRMTAAGLAKLKPDARQVQQASSGTVEVPDFFAEALAGNKPAREFFNGLAPSYRRHFIGWVGSAKGEETRERRLAEALSLLQQQKKLGMK
ncbi:MAG: hypothetical protein GY838_04810 [bacterium]|nr:hypothetical protein [bacterium]